MVEVVAVAVIATILAAYAIPRMMGPSDVAAKITADRVLAAMHIAQTLAQRQGVATGMAVTAPNQLAVSLAVFQAGIPVSFPTQNYDGTDTGGIYDALLHPDVAISAINIAYGTDGVPTSGVRSYSVSHGTLDSFTIKLEPTGYAHFE